MRAPILLKFGHVVVLIFVAALLASSSAPNPAAIQTLLDKTVTGSLKLPSGAMMLHTPLQVSSNAHDLTLDFSALAISLAPDFSSRAAILLVNTRNVRVTGLQVDGRRTALLFPAQGLPPGVTPFSRFTMGNGILAEQATGLTIEKSTFRNIAGFAILVYGSTGVHIDKIEVHDSGSLNTKHRNNTTGGILLEEGTRDFEITGCTLDNISGNGIWTHAYRTSAQNGPGRIADNKVVSTARDAFQVGHGLHVTLENNAGARIGYPVEQIDVDADATPAALDTAGNTANSVYRNNTFEDVNGKCMDLDGFHDGEIRGNSCINHQRRDLYLDSRFAIAMNNANPDMQSKNILLWDNRVEGFLYGGLLLIGSGHRVSHNHFLHLNLAHCNDEAERFFCLGFAGEPDILRSGIYLRRRAERPADTRDNTIEDNEISGYGIGSRCIVAGPGVSLDSDRIARNTCEDDAPVSAELRAPNGIR